MTTRLNVRDQFSRRNKASSEDRTSDPMITNPNALPTELIERIIFFRNRGADIDRPKSQPLMPSRIPSLITKPDRCTSVPSLGLLNTDTPRLSRVAQTRPWRPGSVSPQQIRSETSLPNPKLAKFLDR